MENLFLDRQIEIRQKEISLHGETQKLLSDILSGMTDAQLDSLTDFVIDEFDNSIVSITNNGDIEVEMFDETINHITLENLSQPQQKEIIDFILVNRINEQ